jgi:demethylmenaquinone methyltransferase/2-methoxy-6-polyprenyl-1,4-benzoquinol methylase
MSTPQDTDFGFERVPWRDKARRVRGVFDSVAGNYDLMNDLMSAGTHRLWKRYLLSQTMLRPGQRALDVAGGTGDIARGLAKQVGRDGLVVLSDINAEMLARGRDRLLDEGFSTQVPVVQLDAEKLRSPTAASTASRSRSGCATSPTRPPRSPRWDAR